MKKDYLMRLQQIAQAQLVDEIGRRGIRFFDGVNVIGLDEELNNIIATAIASEINGAGQYPTLKRYIDDCVREDVEQRVVEECRQLLEGYEEESTPSWGDPEITPDYEPEHVEIKLDPEEYEKATAGLTEEELPF